MIDENQLNINFPSHQDKATKKDIKAEEVQKEEKSLMSKEKRRKREEEYWRKVDKIDEEGRERQRQLANKKIPEILETIENKDKDKSTDDEDDDLTPYEEIYPHSRELKRGRKK